MIGITTGYRRNTSFLAGLPLYTGNYLNQGIILPIVQGGGAQHTVPIRATAILSSTQAR